MSVVVSEPPPLPRRAISPVVRFAPGLIALVVFWLAPLPGTVDAHRAIAISVATIIWWATGPLQPAATGLVALVLFAVTGISDLPTIVSGFWNDTTGFLLGALTIGLFVSRTGLAQRLAFSLAAKLGRSYSGLLLALVTVDFVLTFLIPSGIARVAVLAAIVAGLVEATGLPRRDPAARGLMIAVTCSASLFDKMVLAGTSSILASGIIERIGGVRISYGLWFLAYVPCVLLTILGSWRIVLWLFPDVTRTFDASDRYFRESLVALGPPTRQERMATILSAAAIALWLTDVWHDLPPATVALSIGALAFMPGIRLLRPADLLRLPYPTLVFTATALSISAVLSDTGALRLLTGSMVEWMRVVIHGPASASLVLYLGGVRVSPAARRAESDGHRDAAAGRHLRAVDRSQPAGRRAHLAVRDRGQDFRTRAAC
ncbi:MAG: SLC13 family permease [Vicinamibacterales bacterium]